MPTMTIDRMIHWAERHCIAINVNFITGKVILNEGKKNKKVFATPDAALAWAKSFSENWGMVAP